MRYAALGTKTKGGNRIVDVIVFSRLIAAKLDLAARQPPHGLGQFFATAATCSR